MIRDNKLTGQTSSLYVKTWARLINYELTIILACPISPEINLTWSYLGQILRSLNIATSDTIFSVSIKGHIFNRILNKATQTYYQNVDS